jgi:hypothetical protein
MNGKTQALVRFAGEKWLKVRAKWRSARWSAAGYRA